jgi:hypothetical protein
MVCWQWAWAPNAALAVDPAGAGFPGSPGEQYPIPELLTSSVSKTTADVKERTDLMTDYDKKLQVNADEYTSAITDGVQKKAAQQWALWNARGQMPIWMVLKQRLTGRSYNQG